MTAIRELRKRAGLTQIQLAQAIGASQASVSQWEKGETFPRRTFWPKLAEVLQCSIDELVSFG